MIEFEVRGPGGVRPGFYRSRVRETEVWIASSSSEFGYLTYDELVDRAFAYAFFKFKVATAGYTEHEIAGKPINVEDAEGIARWGKALDDFAKGDPKYLVDMMIEDAMILMVKQEKNIEGVELAESLQKLAATITENRLNKAEKDE